MEYLNFQQISKVPFRQVLDHYQIPYKETKREFRGEGFIVSKAKNLYLNPQGDDRGSIINFLSNLRGVSLREAASEIKKTFQETPQAEKELPDYQLHFHEQLEQRGISEELSQKYEVGYCKTGIMRGRITFLVRDEAGIKVAYIGWKKGWLYPKGYKHSHVYNLHRQEKPLIIAVLNPFEVLHLAKLGFPQAVAILHPSMTEEQHNKLAKFKEILLLHPEPQNIADRLSQSCFVKAPSIHSVETLDREDVCSFF